MTIITSMQGAYPSGNLCCMHKSTANKSASCTSFAVLYKVLVHSLFALPIHIFEGYSTGRDGVQQS